MKLNLIFLEAKKDLTADQKRKLREVIQRHAKKAGEMFNLPLLNIIIYLNENNVIPETGEAAYSTGTDFIKITIDPTRGKKEIDKIITNIIPAIIYHEVNHLAREKYTGEIDGGLLNAAIAEGIADTYAEEQWPEFKAPWTKYGSKDKSFLKELKQKKNSKKYSHDEWFFGAGSKPRWLGYKLGKYIIHIVKQKHPQLSAKEMTKLKTQKIFKLSGL